MCCIIQVRIICELNRTHIFKVSSPYYFIFGQFLSLLFAILLFWHYIRTIVSLYYYLNREYYNYILFCQEKEHFTLCNKSNFK